MSDQQQSNVNSQQEEQDQQVDEQQQDQDEDQDQQQGSGQQDEDQEQDEDQQDQQGQDEQGQQQNDQQKSEEQSVKKLPTFKMVSKQPEQFKFTSLLNEISSLSSSVDNFIGTLSSGNTNNYGRRPYISNYNNLSETTFKPHKLQQIKIPQQSHVIMMKDQDTQVDMKPQIIIQPTKTYKQDPVIQAKPYKIASQSQKFLAQLYEQNKKLKRWQNTSHPMNSYMTSFNQSSGINNFGTSVKSFIPNGKDKFQRKDYQKGLFNVQERNRQIDQAILMLKRQQENQMTPYNN